MTAKIRLLVGGTALAAGLGFLTAAIAAPPALPKDSTKKAIEADIASVQALLDNIAADPAKTKGAMRTCRALVLTLGAYAELNGDKALLGQVGKLGEAIDKASDPKGDKDWKAAVEAAKSLSKPPAGGAAPKGPLVKHDLEDVMSPFRVSKGGGMNIEKDIRDFKKAGKIEAKDAELIGARCAVLADYASKMPNDKASVSNATKQKWEKLCKDMAATSKDLTDEAAKGYKADAKKLLATLIKLDNTCITCHGDFRNEP